METVRITTSQNVEIEYPIASVGERVVARVVDYLIFALISIVLAIVFDGFLNLTKKMSWSGEVVATFAWLALFVFYDLICEVFFNGQSLGKLMANIKVISLDGARPTLGQYVMRWIFRVLDFGLSLGALAVVMTSFSDKRQRLGDVTAGTTVIKTKPTRQYADLFFNAENDEEYVPTYTEASLLSDADIDVIHDVLKNFSVTRKSILVYKLAVRIREFLGVEQPNEINEYQFLEIILKDYTALTTRSLV